MTKVSVERTFNLGNYENIRFSFEIEPEPEEGIHETALYLAKLCHVAFEAYSQQLQGMKAKIESEVQRVVEMIKK